MDQTKRSAVIHDETPPPVPLPPTLDAALDRLTAATARLRAAGERHAATRREPAGGEDALMQEDRTRLALERDAALARVARLGEAHGAALERLGRAEASIEAVLADLAEEEDAEEPPIEEAS